MNPQTGKELAGKHKKMQEFGEDPEPPQEQRQKISAAAYQDGTKSNSVLPLPVASCSDQGQNENASPGGAAGASNTEKSTVEATHGSGGGELPPRRYWWGDCEPHVVMLREALLSSAPDSAVLEPLHGCFSFYTTHLHKEVLSSTYARSMTLGANATGLESAFMWVGGWRPTSALVLVYSLMGIEIENALQALRAGQGIGQMATSSLLSPRQLATMHSLQKHTQNAEMRITKKLAVLQMSIGDQDVLVAVLLDAASPVANDSSRFHQVTERRMSRFRRLLIQAEELRLHTLKDLLSLLTPIQAARCGVAIFEMCSALRNMNSTISPAVPSLPKALPVGFPFLAQSVGETLVANSVEPTVSDLSISDGISNPYDVIQSQSDEPLLSDLSSHHRFFNSSDVPFTQSNEPLLSDLSSHHRIFNSSDVPPTQSNEPLLSDSQSSSSPLSVSDVLLADLPWSQIVEPLVSDLSPHNETLNSSDVTLSLSSEPVLSVAESLSSSLNESLVCRSDETQILVASCSNSSSHLLAPYSSRGFDREEESRSLSAILPLVESKLDDDTDGMVPDESAEVPTVGKAPEKVISNRLLLLSPASSDVIIQSCTLDTSEMDSYVEMHSQFALVNSEVEESYEEQPSESGDMSGCRFLELGTFDSDQLSGQNSSRMSAPCFRSSAQNMKCSLHQTYPYNWMGVLWTKNTPDITS